MPGDASGMVATVAAAIREADGYINSYLRQRFAVPLATPTDEVVAMSAAWAARVLRRARYKGQPVADDQEAEKIDRLWLKGVADGTIQLGIEPSPTKSSIVTDAVGERDSSLRISSAKLDDFI